LKGLLSLIRQAVMVNLIAVRDFLRCGSDGVSMASRDGFWGPTLVITDEE
jgi:hypothetical protein